MTEPANMRRNGLRFEVVLDELVNLRVLAPEISEALRVTLQPADAPGLDGEYFADFAGMRIWLQFPPGDRYELPREVQLLGISPESLASDASWVDIGQHIAEHLRNVTGRLWQAR